MCEQIFVCPECGDTHIPCHRCEEQSRIQELQGLYHVSYCKLCGMEIEVACKGIAARLNNP